MGKRVRKNTAELEELREKCARLEKEVEDLELDLDEVKKQNEELIEIKISNEAEVDHLEYENNRLTDKLEKQTSLCEEKASDTRAMKEKKDRLKNALLDNPRDAASMIVGKLISKACYAVKYYGVHSDMSYTRSRSQAVNKIAEIFYDLVVKHQMTKKRRTSEELKELFAKAAAEESEDWRNEKILRAILKLFNVFTKKAKGITAEQQFLVDAQNLRAYIYENRILE